MNAAVYYLGDTLIIQIELRCCSKVNDYDFPQKHKFLPPCPIRIQTIFPLAGEGKVSAKSAVRGRLDIP